MRCESCGHEFRGTYGQACPACGTIAQNPFEQASAPEAPPPSAESSAGPSPWQSPRTSPGNLDGAPQQAGTGIPWEAEQSAQSMFETIKVVLLESQDTFARASRDPGIGPAFIYVLILGIAGGLIGQLWSLAYSGVMGEMAGMEGMENLAALSGGAIGFLAVPVWVVISVFIVSGLVHLTLMMVGGANEGFESTFRVVAYAQGSTALLNVVPVIGSLVALVWQIVVGIIGVKEMHHTTTGKAAAAALLPIFAVCCCFGGLGGLAAWGFANAARGL